LYEESHPKRKSYFTILEGEFMAVNGRVLTKDLDSRLRAVEERLAEITERLSHFDGSVNGASGSIHPSAQPSPDHGDKLTALEARVMRLDERMQKVTATLVEQASRWS
jgi:archaellum component FlaC